MSRRARISRIEGLVSSAVEVQAERRRRLAQVLPTYARRHATAVAAIVLAGEPKMDEPLIRAWARTLQHYEITVKEPTERSEQGRAAQQLFQIIVGEQASSSKFAEIFSTAPAWLLQFTRTVLDAWILRFRLPQMKPNSDWGTAGFADAGHWPFLPLGMMTAGEPIPRYDRRQLVLALLSVGPQGDSIPYFSDLPSEEEQNLSPVLEDLCLAVSLEEKPKQEWSAYERRRMRRFVRRLSRDYRA